MKTNLPLLGLSLLVALEAAAGARAAESKPVTVAVCEFQSFHDRRRQEATDLVIAALAADPKLAVLDRGQLGKVLDEQAMDLTQTLDPDRAARLGHLAGAQILLAGVLSGEDDAGDFLLLVRIISANSGRAYSERVTVHGWGDLPAAAAELATKITGTISAQSANLLATPARSHGEVLADIVGSAKGPHRPAVSLQITVQEGNRILADTTVESELGMILQKAGFRLADAQSAQKPDVWITGEAQAEVGPRRGDLCFGEAVVNLKVVDRATGSILALDRQAAEATDLSERTAIGGAFETASDQLALRLVPRLSN